jgi:Fe2+ transport system protein FeoA
MNSQNIANLSQDVVKKYPIKALIQELAGDPSIVARLHEMGLKAGQTISIEGRAPFGGAFLIRFGTTAIALRSEEAACTQIRLL